jgi:ComF family protein
MFQNLLELFVSNTCYSCDRQLIQQEQWVCFHCLSQIEQTHFHQVPQQNELYYRLAGRIPLEGAAALFFFDKKGRLQQLIQALKYQNSPQLGEGLGKLLGAQIKGSDFAQDLQAIIPVPLHYRKHISRGYNQAAYIARGISQVLDLPVKEGVLKRHRFTQSQTRKQAEARWDNVKSAFRCAQGLEQHLLLVDDVITTGATLVACGQTLLAAPRPPRSLRIASIAMARKQ